MMPGIAIAIFALCAIFLVYPFVVYPALLRALPGRPVRRAPPGAAQPSASLLFCAYDEAASLPAKIANLRDLKDRYPALQILAYDDGSADGTAVLLDAAADVVATVHGPGRAGKAHGMKTLAARASGDILIFTDANVLLDADAVERLLACYDDGQVGGVLGSLRYDGAGATSSAQVGGLYWRLEEGLKAAESRTGNVMGADGSIFSVRRRLYPDFPDSVLDDLTVSMAVVFAGQRLVFAEDVIAREMMVAGRGDEMTRKTRIAARAWHTHRFLRPQLRRMSPLDRFKYASRKLVRWLGALWIVGAVLSALAIAAWVHPALALLAAAAGTMLLAAGLIRAHGLLAALVDIVLAYFATFRGLILAMRGRDFTLWSPAASRMDQPS